MPLTIALDGPVGAGKSTVAQAAARRLGILHLDTGAMYRALGLKMLRAGVELQNEAAVTALAEATQVTVAFDQGEQRTLLDGADVSGCIRTPEVGMAASTISRYAGVRRALVAQQQQLARTQPMLLDGRDIGVRVLPDAALKVYLTADPKERARRRFLELQGKGLPDTYEQVLAEVEARDAQDMGRAVDPLRPAPGARVLDATHLTLEQVVDILVQWAKEAQP